MPRYGGSGADPRLEFETVTFEPGTGQRLPASSWVLLLKEPTVSGADQCADEGESAITATGSSYDTEL